MYPFIETIQLRNGRLLRLDLHSRRMNNTRQNALNCNNIVKLSKAIFIPETCREGLFRCRITYGREIGTVGFFPYQPRSISSLKLTVADHIDYSHKYADRSCFEPLLTQRSGCDEVLIVKEGCVTDTSFSNVLFLRQGVWYTPDTPLLRGVMREWLLAQGRIIPVRIHTDDIPLYEQIMLINAMLEFDENRTLRVTEVKI